MTTLMIIRNAVEVRLHGCRRSLGCHEGFGVGGVVAVDKTGGRGNAR